MPTLWIFVESWTLKSSVILSHPRFWLQNWCPMTGPKCNMSHVHACTILARLCSWGCTYFPGGFLAGRVLMKNSHLNEILTVNWQLSFWILGESVLLRITTTCKCSQEAPQSLKNSSAIHAISCRAVPCQWMDFGGGNSPPQHSWHQCLARKKISGFGQPKCIGCHERSVKSCLQT